MGCIDIEKLTTKQEKFMLALISQPSITMAIEQVNLSQSTAYRWLNDETFKKAFIKFKREIMKNTTAKLQANSLLAIDTLVKIAKDEKAKDTARVSASRTILEYAFKGLEIEDIQERLERLEERTNEFKRNN